MDDLRHGNSSKEDSMTLIQVTVNEGVFTAPKNWEIIERLTDAMVSTEDEKHAHQRMVHRHGDGQRPLGRWRPGAHRRRHQGARPQRAGRSAVSSAHLPTISTSAERAEQLAHLVNELLDAHADTDRLRCGPATELRWQAHLHYLRDLQRTGREILAQGVRS
jgi:phenylpyruvate tautomerase PptA (4-oxalocrotonate tautomerase family)